MRREAWLAGTTVALLALFARYVWLPIDYQSVLEQAHATWGLPVSDVGRWFSAWALGDGQAFAVIAADPLGLDIGHNLGLPAYRYGRAGFGWLSWGASLGQARWVPYGMAIVGALLLVALFVLTVRLRERLGAKAWFLVLNPAVFIAFAGDTSETLGVLLLALALSSGSVWMAMALGVSRPSFLVGLGGRWNLIGAGLAAAVVLGLVWILQFGFELKQYGGGVSWPLVGYLEQPSLQAIVLATTAAATLAIGIWRKDWGWVLSGMLVLSFSPIVLETAANSWRTAGFLFVLWAFGPGYGVSTSTVSRAEVLSTG